MSKKWFSILIVVVLLASTFSVALAEVTPGTCPHGETVKVGRQGFRSTNTDFPCQTEAYAVRASSAPTPKTLKFVRPLLRLESKTVKPEAVVFSGKTLVYFDLNKNQEKAWKSGVLAVYYYDLTTRTWNKLSSAQVPLKGKGFRVSSRIYHYGYFGLAKTK